MIAGMDALRSAWEAFLDGSDAAPAGVPAEIVASWRRSRELAVSPDLATGPWAEDPVEAAPTTRLFADLGSAAIRELAADLRGAGAVVVLADAAGRVLARAGDPDITRRTDAAQMSPGAAWSEGATGTNGIGLALALGRPVQVVAAEHFCSSWHGYGCTSAPVRHPVTEEILGALTLTTRASVHDRPMATALVNRVALGVRHALAERIAGPDRALLARHVRAPAPGQPRLTINRRGDVVLENDAAAHRLLGPAREAVLGIARTALAGPFDVAETLTVPGLRARLGVRVTIVRWQDDVAGAVATVDALPVPDRDSTLRDLERELILATLDRLGGNVTAAAAELGISRATLYRRLQTYRVLGG